MSFSLEYLEAAYLAHMVVSYENLVNRIGKKEDVRNFSNGFDASFAEKLVCQKTCIFRSPLILISYWSIWVKLK